jgi:hypothetical protein
VLRGRRAVDRHRDHREVRLMHGGRRRGGGRWNG